MIKSIFKCLCLGVLMMFGLAPILSYFFLNKQEGAGTLEEMIGAINKDLPREICYGSNLVSITIKDSTINWNIEMDTAVFCQDKILPKNSGLLPNKNGNYAICDLDTFFSNNMFKLNHKYLLMYNSLFDGKSLFYKELMKRKMSQKWIYHYPYSGKSAEYELSYQEMKMMEDKIKHNRDEALKELLPLYCNLQKSIAFYSSINSDIAIDFQMDSANFAYIYTLGPQYEEFGNKPIENCRLNKQEILAAAIQDLQILPIFSSAKKMSDVYKKDIRFRYRDCMKTDSMELVVYNHQ